MNMDPKVLGDIDIGSSKGRHGSEKREVGDILHGCQKEGGAVFRKHVSGSVSWFSLLEFFVWE